MTLPRLFLDAMEEYDRAQEARYDLAMALPRLRAKRDEERAVVAALEAQEMLNGGSGRNAELRTAWIKRALADSTPYQQALARLRESDIAISENEAAQEDLSNTMRACRLRVEFLTSANYREAAAEGGREFRRLSE